MSYAPDASLVPPPRPAAAWWEPLWPLPSAGLPEPASLSATSLTLVLLGWLVVLAVTLLWVRRQRRIAGRTRPGSWRLLQPEQAMGDASADCDWQVAASRMASGQQKWHCRTCGQDGFSTTRNPPGGCAWSQ